MNLIVINYFFGIEALMDMLIFWYIFFLSSDQTTIKFKFIYFIASKLKKRNQILKILDFKKIIACEDKSKEDVKVYVCVMNKFFFANWPLTVILMMKVECVLAKA